MIWMGRYFLSEAKKAFTYRVEFWVGFFGNIASQFAVAYFLWKAIFAQRGAVSMQGFSFLTLMAYYLIAPLMERLVHGGESGQISRDIYEGGLSKYLVYPISFFNAKLMTHLSQTVLACGQLCAVLLLMTWPGPFDLPFDPLAWGACLLLLGLSILVQFAMTACLELLAFWVDNVWSLSVMLRMVLHLAGGSMVPLVFFPEKVQTVFHYLPFQGFIDLPTRLILGHASLLEAGRGMAVAVIWALGLGLTARLFWQRGLMRYSGAGM